MELNLNSAMKFWQIARNIHEKKPNIHLFLASYLIFIPIIAPLKAIKPNVFKCYFFAYIVKIYSFEKMINANLLAFLIC